MAGDVDRHSLRYFRGHRLVIDSFYGWLVKCLMMFSRRRRRYRLVCVVVILLLVVLCEVSVDNTEGQWGVHVRLRFRKRPTTPSVDTPIRIKVGKARSRWRKQIDERRRRLQRVCTTQSAHTDFTQLNLRHFQYNHKHRMLYCGVEKSGSTFWRRLLQQIDKNVIISPYNIRPENGLLNYRNLANETLEELDDILKFSVKFMVARDPYTRLLSGYIDKLYSPNVYFWDSIGEHIVRAVRPNATMKSKTCGHDVTFLEFVKYVIKSQTTGEKKDSHFMPAVEICNPCKVRFDIISQMETFRFDVRFILETFNLRSYLGVIDGPSYNMLNDTIYDVAQAFVSMRTDIRRCMSVHAALLRVWEKLQIKGIVSLDIPCPFKKDEVSGLTIDIMTSVIREALDSASLSALKSQRKSLFLKFYRQIPLDVLRKLADVFKNDFDHFGYEQYPAILFKRVNTEKTIG
ncbi:carbohydrate sulfotransferase 11-like [Ylistrum balloti]|uniref:carbohydrate sulfotransferase 11-like n=1 Tax=Ylistrum balloti TaxID=509963 RepID=UPI0029058857|nr:carbohydrate sulfotransferase 11-like [Ylistrum balloti]